MTFICQVCGDPCDEFGNCTDTIHDPLEMVVARTCIPCRLEALRVKKYGVQTVPKPRSDYLPYKDD